jgi:glycosyltransferase involved in cell wall biosynthesis
MKALFLTRYGALGASSRVRAIQFFDTLEAQGIQCVLAPLFSDSLLDRKYQTGRYGMADLIRAYSARVIKMMTSRHFDLVWIEKEALPWVPAIIERAILRGVPYALDYDDAVFHNYDRSRHWLVRRILGRRIDSLFPSARFVTVGNDYLAARARAGGAHAVIRIPSCINADSYLPKADYRFNGVPRIVWIGTPSTMACLDVVKDALREVARSTPFLLRVIGGRRMPVGDVQVEWCPWSLQSESGLLAESDVGIMPLTDSPWARGKCGFKLVQYMASGLPAVASPVGVNAEIVRHGRTGFLATSTRDWIESLSALLHDRSLRQAFGQAGREIATREYSVNANADKLVECIRAASA